MTDCCPSTILDQAALDNIRSLNNDAEPDVLGKVVCIYLRNSPQLLRSLSEAVAKCDAPVIEQAAHSLKSSSAMLGAMKLANLLTELEEVGHNHSDVNSCELVSAIEAEFIQVCKALKAELQAACSDVE
ncbi:Hpt domain protein [Geotalea uraniireducens Rf4]|uniref:Hpt domain protein n=2 Tax=Geotalea uraniireducens TaxID=351604 RepID=A5GB54_GEOUR|nr:Hpt domain protein [Geotalea uraniireducens Rf4]